MGSNYTKRGKWIVRIILTTLIVNFLTFSVGAFILGGTAVNGYFNNDQYFVGDHGRYSEVTSAQWTYSYYHAFAVITNFIFFALVFPCLLFSGDAELGESPW